MAKRRYATALSAPAVMGTPMKVAVRPRWALVISDVTPGNQQIVTRHRVAASGSAFQIDSGMAVSSDAILELAASMTGAAGLQLIDSHVLASDFNTLVWWRPAAIRPMHLRHGDKSRSIKVMWPHLLFAARGARLKLFALAESKRPDASTVLYQAPLGNVDADGEMCWGSVPPVRAALANLGALESAVFDTAFSHPNVDQLLSEEAPTRHLREGAQDINRFWVGRSRGTPQPLPAEWLIDAGHTLGSLLKELG